MEFKGFKGLTASQQAQVRYAYHIIPNKGTGQVRPGSE